MTIAVGFRCLDGVLLCADSQLTIPAYLKFQEAKIISMAGLHYSPCFVYCGSEPFSKDGIFRIGEAIHDAENNRRVIADARNKLREIYNEQRALDRQDRNTLELLLALKRGSTFQLWHILRTTISPVSRFYPIGAGLDMMHAVSQPFYSPQMTLREASYMGAYALYLTREYVDSCGKNSLVYLLYDDGRRAVVTQEEIEELEASFAELCSISAEILISRDRVIFSKSVERLNEQLQDSFARRERRGLLFL